jgi:hypothetical protein
MFPEVFLADATLEIVEIEADPDTFIMFSYPQGEFSETYQIGKTLSTADTHCYHDDT